MLFLYRNQFFAFAFSTLFLSKYFLRNKPVNFYEKLPWKHRTDSVQEVKAEWIPSSTNRQSLRTNLDYVAVIYAQAAKLRRRNRPFNVWLHQGLRYLIPGVQVLGYGTVLFLVLSLGRGAWEIADAREFCAKRESLESCAQNPWVTRSTGENTRILAMRMLGLGIFSGWLYLTILSARAVEQAMVDSPRNEKSFWKRELILFSSSQNAAVLDDIRALIRDYPKQPDQSSEQEYLQKSISLLEQTTFKPYDDPGLTAKLNMQRDANIANLEKILHLTDKIPTPELDPNTLQNLSFDLFT